jgi:hypothetical protein
MIKIRAHIDFGAGPGAPAGRHRMPTIRVEAGSKPSIS